MKNGTRLVVVSLKNQFIQNPVQAFHRSPLSYHHTHLVALDLRAKSERVYGGMKEAERVLLNNLNIEWTYILLEVRF